MDRRTNTCFLTVVVLILLCLACYSPNLGKKGAKSDYSREVCIAWNQLLLTLERHTPGYRPPVSARMLAYVALSAYESALPALTEQISMELYLKGFKKTAFTGNVDQFCLPASLNASYAQILRRFFATSNDAMRAEIDALEKKIEMECSKATKAPLTESIDFAKLVATQVWQWSLTDSIGYKGFTHNYEQYYKAPECKGCWQPSAPLFLQALVPEWGKVRTFIVPLEAINANPPIPYNENPGSPYYTEAMEVFSVSQPLSKENKWIAEFWSDDLEGFTLTPACRWISIVNQVLEQKQPDITRTLQIYLKASLALNDVAVHCWSIKYRYNVERPQAFIRRMIDGNWSPLHGDPSFPAYPSGHACFGAAVAAILAVTFGDSFEMEDRTHQDRHEFDSKPRSFHSFSEMARENALSRIVGGVHYRMDCEEGLRIGQIIGQKIATLPLQNSKVSLK